MNGMRSLLVPVAMLAACLAAYFLIFLPPTLHDVGPMSDFTTYDLRSFFLPKFVYGSHELARGVFPLWNPYEYGGIPFFATAQPAVLYPPKAILFALFDESTAYWSFMVFHYVVLAGGFLWFLREQKIVGLAAFAGAAAWTLSVPVLFSNYHPTRIANLAFVPFCFVFVERIGFGVAVKRSAAWLVVVLALQLTAGYPEFTADLGILVAVHAAVRFFTKAWTLHPMRSVPLFAALFCVAASIVAIQLVPMVEAALVARRTDVANTVQKEFLSLPDATNREIALTVPGFYIFGILALPRRRARPAAAGLVLCVAIASGAWPLLRFLPGFSMVRFPFVWFVYSVFYAGWLVAIEMDVFLGVGSDRPSRRTLVAIGIVEGLWASFCLFEWFLVRSEGVAGRAFVHRLGQNVRTPTAAALGFLGSVAICALTIPKWREKAFCWAPAPAVALLLLVLSHEAAVPFGAAPANVTRPGTVGEIREYASSGVSLTGRALSLRDIARGYSLTDHVPTLFGAEESFVPWRYRRIQARASYAPSEDRIDWGALVSSAGFLSAMNLEYVVAPRALMRAFVMSGFRPLRMDRERRALMKSPRTMGEAWVNFVVRSAPSADLAELYVLGRDFEPAREAVVETPLSTDYLDSGPFPPSVPALVQHVSTTKEEIVVELPRPGVLVVSESFYPGWTALIDGHPSPIIVADYVLRAVEVPAGEHRVVFEYRPASVRWGLVLSVLGLVALTALFSPNRPAGDRFTNRERS